MSVTAKHENSQEIGEVEKIAPRRSKRLKSMIHRLGIVTQVGHVSIQNGISMYEAVYNLEDDELASPAEGADRSDWKNDSKQYRKRRYPLKKTQMGDGKSSTSEGAVVFIT